MMHRSLPQNAAGHKGQLRHGHNTPPVSNTGGAIPHRQVSGGDVAILRHGLDTCYWYCALSPDVVAECVSVAEFGVESGGDAWSRGGANGYAYTYSSEGLRVLVPSAAGLHMGLYIMAGASWCLGHEPRAYESTIDGVLMAVFGITAGLRNLRLSRVDLAFDAAGLVPEFGPSEIVSRARSRALYHTGEALTGAAVGKGDVRFRLYDKTVEAEASGHLAMWRDAWGGYAGTVWRAEYQLRGQFLRQYHVDTIAELLAVMGDIVTYLQSWVRFAEVQGHKGTDRPLLGWWADLVDAVQGLQMAAIGAVRDFTKRMPSLEGLKAQLIGLAAAVAAAHTVTGGTLSPLEYLADVLFSNSDRIEFKAQEKQVDYRQRMYA